MAGVLTVIILLVLALWLGKLLWRVAEPGDDDPGGRATSMADVYRGIFSGTPFVDYLRLYRKLRGQHGRRPTTKSE